MCTRRWNAGAEPSIILTMDKGALPHGSALGKIFRLLRGINIHPAYIAIPLMFSLLAAASEGITLSLLIPMLNGFLTKDYSFILTLPGLSSILQILPLFATANDRSLFITLIALFVLCALLKNILRYSSAVSMGYFTSRALHHLRKVMFARFLSFGKLYFDRTSVGHNSTVLLQFAELVFLPLQQETLLLHATLRHNIAYGLRDVRDERIRQVTGQARLTDVVSRLPQGLDTLIGDRGVKLSGGEKQRVSIARALLKGAEILILDEATSALDSRTEKLIQEAIDEAVRGRTAIVIAHRLSTIRHADKIVVLEDGRVAEEGTLQELLDRKGHFFRLWEEQKFVQ